MDSNVKNNDPKDGRAKGSRRTARLRQRAGSLSRIIRKKTERYLTDEESQLAARYRDLYGDGTYEDELAAFRSRRRQRMILLLSMFLLVFCYAAHREFAGTPGAVYEGERLVALERPEDGSALSLDARIYAVTEKGTVTEDRAVYLGAYSEEQPAERTLAEESYEDMIVRKIDQTARSLDQDRTARVVYLPDTLDDGTRLVWTERRQSLLPLLLALFGAILYYLYKSRFAGIEKKEQEARESVIRELPEFLHKLVLLLGAGAVLESAFVRAMEGIEGDSYFAGQMQYIKQRAAATNAPLAAEFRAFAQRSGVRELVRIAGILGDNVERGTDLTVKLREESELLWFERKKQSEEKGRLAETKLTMPLAILLIVLVVVTVSPALFEM